MMAMVSGAWRFAVVSLAAFSIWAFGGNLSEGLLYGLIALAFVALSGLLMFPLLEGERRLFRFYRIFIPGFLAYAALWCLGWFGVGGHEGEIVGSASGLASMSLVVVWIEKKRSLFLTIFSVLFLCHTLGYTLGAICYYSSHGQGVLAFFLESKITLGRLLWERVVQRLSAAKHRKETFGDALKDHEETFGIAGSIECGGS
ncbi:MAG: hypothetical protein AAF492_21510 [Verrucomicrobiota bacterium]